LARHSRRSLTPYDDHIVYVIAAAAAVAAALAPGAPTGLAPVDALAQGALAGLVTLAGGRARRWSILVLAAVATATALGWTFVPALASLGLALAMAARRRRLRLLGAVSAALAVQALLRQDPYLFQGTSVLVGAVALAPVLASAHRRSRMHKRRRNLVVIGVTLGAATLAVVVFALAAVLAAPDLRTGATEARAALNAGRRGDTVEAQERLDRASAAFRSAQRWVGGPWAQPARLVPVVSQHVDAVQVATDQGLAMSEAGNSVARVGDYQDLRYESGRIDLDRVRALVTPLGQAADVLGTARSRLRDLERTWLVGPVDTELDSLVGEIGRTADEATMASAAVEVAPGLLGGDGPRTYFVAFVNPAEERGGGGFLGAYGELSAIDGELELTESGPIRELIAARRPGERSLAGPADYLARYGQFSPADFFQDVTFSPHFPYTADVIGQLYPQSGGTEVDGVISLDPFALAALLTFTGPIDVPDWPEPLTTDNAAQVILRDQYLAFGPEDDSLRKDLLTDASEIAFDELTSGSLPGPEQLIEVMGPMVDERRVGLSAVDPDEQALFERIGADGAMPANDGDDVFMVAHQNFGNSKIDAYLERSVDYRAEIDPSTGGVSATATVTMVNNAPAEGLPRVVIGNGRDAPFGTNLMNLVVYSPLELSSAQLDGEELAMGRSTETGLGAYTARIDVPPEQSRTLTVRLEGGLDLSNGRYELTVLPQAMVNPDEINVDLTLSDGWRFGRSGGARAADAPGAADPPGAPVEVSETLVPG
jgi:hypothetical protein